MRTVTQPRISIIIPSYNYGRYLERAILSALGQLPTGAVQIIVADGGSIDETLSIFDKYKKFIEGWSRPDKGYVDAVNQALQVARAEVIGILSADDFYLPGAFAAALNGLQKYPAAAFVTGREVQIDEQGLVIHQLHCPNEITARSLLIEQIPPQNATFVRRKWIDQIGGLRLLDGSNFGADVDLWYRILHYSHGRSIEQTISVYQVHPAQMTRQRVRLVECLLWMVRDCAADPAMADRLHMSARERDSILAEMEMRWFSYSPETLERSLSRARHVVTNPGGYHCKTLLKARERLGFSQPWYLRAARRAEVYFDKVVSASRLSRCIHKPPDQTSVDLQCWKRVVP